MSVAMFYKTSSNLVTKVWSKMNFVGRMYYSYNDVDHLMRVRGQIDSMRAIALQGGGTKSIQAQHNKVRAQCFDYIIYGSARTWSVHCGYGAPLTRLE
jgi:hypothetical protein